MLSAAEWILITWSAMAAVWCLVALTLVWRATQNQKPEVGPPKSEVENQNPTDLPPTLTIFKPLPPLAYNGSGHPPALLVRALESFVSQFDQRHDLLLGVEARDHALWQPVFGRNLTPAP